MARLCLLACWVWLALATPALAQSSHYRLERPAGEVDDATFERARGLYEEGLTHVDAGRWADALERFEASYRLSGIAAALFNAATTLRSMGRHRDARDAFDQLLADHDDLDAGLREQAVARRHEEAGRVALILLSGLSDAPDARILLDGLAVEVEARDPAELETDPGRHAVRVEREGFESWREEVTLTDGERTRLRVDLRAIETAAPIIVAEEGEAIHESPVFWTIVGVVLAGVGVGLGIFLYQDAQLRPDPGFSDLVITP
ncbi:MAG: PEGA domain-containing protein [Myxococcota bacterium]|nr:PEGA domain-containing protein [Myxococcota bacterium]